MIYLDNASTTQIDQEVLYEMMPYLTTKYGNPGTTYKLGQEAKKAIDIARERVAAFLRADNVEQIIFTSGGTESNNMVFSLNRYISSGSFGTISGIEHDSIMNIAINQRASGFYNIIDVDESGKIIWDSFQNNINGFTMLVSVMFANNEIGSINPIEKIGEYCSENGILFHSDCVQAAGCIKIDVNELNLDFASISSHKIHGPKGVGALYIKDKSVVFPNYMRRVGGKDQEFGIRGGTENVAGIVGFGKACELLTGNEMRIGANITVLKKKMWSELRYHFSKYGMLDILHDNADSSNTFGKVLNIRIDGIDAETMLLMLSAQDVYVSAGSACRSHEQEPSRVLKAIGLTDDQARDSIRISFSKYNTENEVCEAAKIIANTAFRLREYVGF